MAAVRILLALFCLAFTCSSWGFGSNYIRHGSNTRSYISNHKSYTSNIIDYGNTNQKQNYGRGTSFAEERKKLIAIAQKEIGVRESVENSGKRVDMYNAYVGLRKVAWCASYVSWVFGQAGYPQPRTAWSPLLFPADRIAKDPLAGMIMGVYFPALKRIAHVGIVERVNGNWIITIEGNTRSTGSATSAGNREGDGVYRRWRHFRTIHRFADWLKKL